MPRGGRRGRYGRFLRDNDTVPPPPPPPNVEHMRWSFSSPPRRGRRNGPRSWIIDSSNQNRSPPTRWMPHQEVMMEDLFLNDLDVGSQEICFVCGDLVSNHPEVPTIHLCDNGDYAVMAANTEPGQREGHGLTSRGAHRRDHDPPFVQEGNYADPVDEAGATANHPAQQQNVENLMQQLQGSYLSFESLNHMQDLCEQMQDLCGRLKDDKSAVQSGREERYKDNPEGFTEEMIGVLETGLKDQYQTFVDRVRQQIKNKSSSLEAEIRNIKQEKEVISTKMSDIEAREKELEGREKEVAEMRRKVEADRAKLLKENDAEKMEVRRQWQKLNDEVNRMEHLHNLQQGRIKLDVGGITFTTSTTTLTCDSDSMLAAMFSGRHELKQEEDGTVFIDRDGTHFRYILNYLRDGATEGSMPESQQALKELLNEAIYYQITGLVEAIEEKLQ